MKFIARIRTWFARLLGKEVETATEGLLKCSICGTEPDSGATECPLCGSTDLVPPDQATGSSAESFSNYQPNEHTAASADEPVQKLQRMRTEQLLDEHHSLWEETDEGYTVNLPSGTQTVATKEEVAQAIKTQENG